MSFCLALLTTGCLLLTAPAAAFAVDSPATPGHGAVRDARPGRAASHSERRRPNVFLIVIDTLRADHLSAYGYDKATSPHIDALAAQGTLYEEAISAAPWTLPSHASLFTGLYVRDHHTSSEHPNLDPSYDTLAERLARAGYHTGGFSNNVWTNPDSGLEQGFQRFEELWRLQKVRSDGISVDDPTTDMGAAKTDDDVLSWIDGLKDDRPFFVFINFFEPHLPYRPTKPFDDDFLPAGASPALVRRMRSFYSPREYGYILNVPWMKVSERELGVLRGLYDGEIAYVDSKIGELVDGLRARGLADDTVLVITSDHGEHLGENHMLGHKLSVYEPLLHVPLVLWGPGRIPAGRRIAGQVQSLDLFGTILDLAGVDRGEAPKLPLQEPAPGYTFSELAYPQIFLDVIHRRIPGWDASRFARALTTVRGSRYKLISGSDGSRQLYDLRADPHETKNLAASRPKELGRLERVLEEFQQGKR